MEIFDISPLLSSQTAVFPGDTPFAQKVICSFENGQNFRLSSIQSTVHLGAHADAPNHYDPRGGDIASAPLSSYVGEAQVIELSIERGLKITPQMIHHVKIVAPRILFKTQSFPDPNLWNSDFNSISPETIQYLAEKSVCLIGIDTPSVDGAEDKILRTHHEIFKHRLAILEGLDLSQVNPGVYTLVALPLKMKGLDASPVRAVLIRDQKKDAL